MPEISRLSGGTDCFELVFVEREATPCWAMKLGIRLHPAGLSLSNTVSELERIGVNRSRSTVHKWVQKAGRQPTDGKSPDHVAVDESVIQIDNQRCCRHRHQRIPPREARNSAKPRPLRNLLWGITRETRRRRRHQNARVFQAHKASGLVNAVILVDVAPWLQEALRRHGLRFQHVTRGNRNTVEHLYKEIKRRTNQFTNYFRHVDPATAETWLLAQAFCQNQLI